MTKNNIKDIIDFELRQIKLTEQIKNNVRNNAIIRKPNRVWRSIAASLVIAILGGSTVFAGYQILDKIYVNEEILPALDAMQIVQINTIDAVPDEYGLIHKEYSDYNTVKNELGVNLLDSHLSDNNPYMMCHVKTDAKDFAIITVDNYILGDTDSYQFLEAENRYSYNHGTDYFSPISLTADLILSEAQMNNGWDTDYLGLYEFVECYTSAQGYIVNIVQDTTLEKDLENYISEKAAIFVADGIRYSLKGRVSIDVIKNAVSTMK